MKTVQAFVTELTRVVRNTDLDDPVKFAAFRQVAEERIQSYCDQENKKLRSLAEKAQELNSDILARSVGIPQKTRELNKELSEALSDYLKENK